MSSAAQGYAAHVGLGVISGNTTPTVGIDFQRETIALAEHFIDANGVRGTQARSIERNLQGNRPCMGSLYLQPTAVELSHQMQSMMGGTPTGNTTVTYPLGETRPLRTIVVDRVTNVYSYNTTAIEGWTISGEQDKPLDFELKVVALDEYITNTYPALTLDTTTFPFKFTDCIVNANGTVYNPKNFRLTADFHVDKDRFFNSQTLTLITSQDRDLHFEALFADAEAQALYGLGRAGFSVVITATSANAVLTMTMPAVAVPRETPTVPGRREIMLNIRGQCFKSGNTLELVSSLNATP